MVVALPETIPPSDKAEAAENSVGNDQLYDDAYQDLAPQTSSTSTSSERASFLPTSSNMLAGGDDGFQITDSSSAETDSDSTAAETHSDLTSIVEVLPSLEPAFDPVFRANELDAAFNGGLFDIGTDKERALSALRQLTPEEIDQVESVYAEMHLTTPLSEVRSEGLGEPELKLFESILNSKNEIPISERIDGADKLIDGSGLTAGETNRVTLADGRQYDIYVPVNARRDLSLIIAPHGTEFGNAADNRTVEKESGLSQLAEQYGVAVVYPYAKPRESGLFGSGVGELEGSGWNLAGHVDLTTDDLTYDDGEFLDAVIADVESRVEIDDTRISVAGFSDGARAAEQYVLDRPGKFESLISMSGTWMKSEAMPEEGTGVRTIIVHGGRDYMLDYDQGEKTLGGLSEIPVGPVSDVMWSLGYIPNFPESRPSMQIEAARVANGGGGEPTVSTKDGVRKTEFTGQQTKTGNEVIEYFVEGAQHGWHDWRNGGSWSPLGISLGAPDHRQNFSEEIVRFHLGLPVE